MINPGLNRKILIEKAFGAMAVTAKDTINRETDPSVTSGILYTDPELVTPPKKLVCGLIVVIDRMTEEITPQLVVANSSDEYYAAIQRAAMFPRKAYKVAGDGLREHIIISYDEFNHQSLATVSDIDVKSIVRIIGELLAEDLNVVENYIKSINGNMQIIAFQPSHYNTPAGPIIKERNTFMFPDGLIIVLKSVLPSGTGDFIWDYDINLSNEIMRGAKIDGAFSNKSINSNGYGNPSGYGPTNGYNR